MQYRKWFSALSWLPATNHTPGDLGRQQSNMNIYLPATSKRVTVGQYVTAIKTVKACAPGTTFKHGLNTWTSATREQILGEFLMGVHHRINMRAGRPEASNPAPAELVRDAARVRQSCAMRAAGYSGSIDYLESRTVRKRLAHLLRDREAE
jgi:hypothetical protein